MQGSVRGQSGNWLFFLDYTEAQRLPNLSRGEDLYRSRCDACHSLGTKDGLGAWLAGVTGKRDRVWLARWLKVPDQMLVMTLHAISKSFATMLGTNKMSGFVAYKMSGFRVPEEGGL